ncbi:MAG: tetratricopeptide repeat protein [Thermonemataceae bacterium]
MKVNVFLSILAMMLGSFAAYAQAQYNWPDDPKQRAEAEKHNVLYYDAMQAGNYEESAKSLGILLTKYPKLSEEVYKGAAKVYPELIQKLTDEEAKKAYQDTFMMSFDQRIEHFGKAPFVTNYKGYYAYQFYSTRPEKHQETYDLYMKIMELNGNKTYFYNAQYAMAIVATMYVGKKLPLEQGIKDYKQISAIAKHNVSNNEKEKTEWTNTEEEINKMFAQYFKPALTCDFIRDNLSQKFKETKSLEEAKKLQNLMVAADCYKEDLFVQVMEVTSKEEPSYENMKALGKLYEAKGNNTKSVEYYNKAANMARSGVEKGKAYKEIMEIYVRTGAKQSGRSYAQKMMQADPSQSSYGYTVIGNLYLGSGGQCSNDNKVKAKAYAIAAYNAYQKAGNSAKMATAKQYFPSNEEIFFEKLKGQSYTLECWIGETVTIP